jgi:hypothetical protein
MRGWLAVPLIGSDGANYGFIQASDRLEGDFTEQDEANLVRLASLNPVSTGGDELVIKQEMFHHQFAADVPLPKPP